MESIEHIRSKILPVLKKYKVKRAGLFGSFSRGQGNEQSDVDLLVEVDANTSLLEFVAIKHELEDILGREVDLVEYEALKPAIRDEILKGEIALL